MRAQQWAYRQQGVAIDPDVHAAFTGAAVAAFAGFAVLGFVSSLTGGFLLQIADVASPVKIGAVASAVLAGGVASQVAFARAPRRRQLLTGAGLVVTGAVVIAAAALAGSLAAYTVGGFLSTGGVGLAFSASVATVLGLAAPDRRSGTLAALFLAACIGTTVPVAAVGALLLAFDLVPVLVGFVTLVAVAVPAGIAVLVRQVD